MLRIHLYLPMVLRIQVECMNSSCLEFVLRITLNGGKKLVLSPHAGRPVMSCSRIMSYHESCLLFSSSLFFKNRSDQELSSSSSYHVPVSQLSGER